MKKEDLIVTVDGVEKIPAIELISDHECTLKYVDIDTLDKIE